MTEKMKFSRGWWKNDQKCGCLVGNKYGEEYRNEMSNTEKQVGIDFAVIYDDYIDKGLVDGLIFDEEKAMMMAMVLDWLYNTDTSIYRHDRKIDALRGLMRYYGWIPEQESEKE